MSRYKMAGVPSMQWLVPKKLVQVRTTSEPAMLAFPRFQPDWASAGQNSLIQWGPTLQLTELKGAAANILVANTTAQ